MASSAPADGGVLAGGLYLVAGDVVDLDPVRSWQQRPVLTGQQVGGHDRPLGGVQRADRGGECRDDPAEVVAAQQVNADQSTEVADRWPDPLPPAEVRCRDLLGCARAVEIQQPGVGCWLRCGRPLLVLADLVDCAGGRAELSARGHEFAGAVLGVPQGEARCSRPGQLLQVDAAEQATLARYPGREVHRVPASAAWTGLAAD